MRLKLLRARTVSPPLTEIPSLSGDAVGFVGITEIACLIGGEPSSELFIRVERLILALDEIENQLIGDLTQSRPLPRLARSRRLSMRTTLHPAGGGPVGTSSLASIEMQNAVLAAHAASFIGADGC